jgi:hypothetical protein
VLGLGEQQQVVHQPADAGDLALDVLLGASHVGGARILLGGQDLELAADHGDRSAELVGGVGDEVALALELGREAVEHAVEGIGEHLDLPSADGGVHARLQLARVDPGGHRGHAAQRSRHPGAGQVGGHQRQRERQGPGQDEGPRDAVLGALDDRQRLARPHHRRHAADEDPALQDPHPADVGDLHDRVAEVRTQQPLGVLALLRLLRGALVGAILVAAGDLRVVERRPAMRSEHEQERGRRAERLRADVALSVTDDDAGAVAGERAQGLAELVGVTRGVAVDLGPQLRTGVVVDDEEDHRHGHQQHSGHPSRQPPAQSLGQPAPDRPGETVSPRGHRTGSPPSAR